MKTLKHRRKENKTDYLKRLKLLKSGKPRLVLRRTNKYFIAQYVVSEEARDKVVFGSNSKSLVKFGLDKKFEGSLKSLPATYLFGLYFGKEIRNKNLETPILDLGMARTIHGTRIFSFIKGLVDSGLKIKYKEESFPEEKKIKGSDSKLSESFDKIKSNIEKK